MIKVVRGNFSSALLTP
nr:hypothetical protein [Vibrio parahaemolyticus]